MLFALCATVLGEDITTTDGTVYKDIRVTEITPIGINFVSNEKACWTDFRDLPPDVAQKYGYDPAKAAEFEKSLAQNQGSNVVAGDPSEMVADKAALEEDTIQSAAATPVQGGGIIINAPVTNTIVNVVPPPSPQVIVVNNGDTVVYDQQIDYEPATTVWVLWGGRYYPRSYWHYWYWKDRYVYCDGRYYPAHSYYRGGVWDHGRYYKYAPDPRRNFPSGNRDSRVSYSAHKDNHDTGRKDNHDTGKINLVNNDRRNTNQAQTVNRASNNNNQTKTTVNRGSNQTQTVAPDNRTANQAQTVNNDNRAKVQNVVNDNRKVTPTTQVDNQNSVRTQNPAKDNRAANQVQSTNNDSRAKAQNVVNDNRKPAAQVENQNSARTQNAAKDNRGGGQAQPGVDNNANDRTGGNNRGDRGDREDRR